ncbi:MAG: YaiO family outer membrane beta-barrel protein [Acidiferrobacteraceae bacterium]
MTAHAYEHCLLKRLCGGAALALALAGLLAVPATAAAATSSSDLAGASSATASVLGLDEGLSSLMFGAGAPLGSYSARQDYASFTAGAYSSNHGYPADNFQRAEVGLHDGRASWVLQLNRVNRFGLTDQGAAGYLYYALGDGYWGYLYGAFNPNSQFLPRSAYGAELDRQIGRFGWGFGYRRMNFMQEAVDMYMPSASLYFGNHLSVTARLYYVPVSQAYSVSIMPVYQDRRHNRYYVDVAAGEIAARSNPFQNFQKYSGYSVAVGAERRLDPRFSVGADVLYQHRSGLYDRHGVDIYLKTWW